MLSKKAGVLRVTDEFIEMKLREFMGDDADDITVSNMIYDPIRGILQIILTSSEESQILQSVSEGASIPHINLLVTSEKESD